MLNNFLWWFCYSKVRLTVRKSLRLLCWLNESVLHLVDFLPLAECHHHRLCGAAVHHAWGEGMLNDFQSVTMSIYDLIFTLQLCIAWTYFVSNRPVCSFFLPSHHKSPLKKKKNVCILAGPAPQGGDPQHAAALAPDLLVAGVTALVPAPTPPDRWVPCLLSTCVLLDSLSDQLEFLIPRPPGLNTNKIICIVANTNMCLHVESRSLYFSPFFCVQMWVSYFFVKSILKHRFCVYVVSSWVGAPLRSTDVSSKVWLLFNLYWIFRHFQK